MMTQTLYTSSFVCFYALVCSNWLLIFDVKKIYIEEKDGRKTTNVKRQLKFLLFWHFIRWHGEMLSSKNLLQKLLLHSICMPYSVWYNFFFFCYKNIFYRTFSEWKRANMGKKFHAIMHTDIVLVCFYIRLSLQVIAYAKTKCVVWYT